MPTNYQIGGCGSRHGLAASTCADNEISVASSPSRPASMTPIGSPSAFQYNGRFTAGCPEMLYNAVYGVNRFCRSKFSAGLASLEYAPRAGGHASGGPRNPAYP